MHCPGIMCSEIFDNTDSNFILKMACNIHKKESKIFLLEYLIYEDLYCDSIGKCLSEKRNCDLLYELITKDIIKISKLTYKYYIKLMGYILDIDCENQWHNHSYEDSSVNVENLLKLIFSDEYKNTINFINHTVDLLKSIEIWGYSSGSKYDVPGIKDEYILNIFDTLISRFKQCDATEQLYCMHSISPYIEEKYGHLSPSFNELINNEKYLKFINSYKFKKYINYLFSIKKYDIINNLLTTEYKIYVLECVNKSNEEEIFTSNLNYDFNMTSNIDELHLLIFPIDLQKTKILQYYQNNYYKYYKLLLTGIFKNNFDIIINFTLKGGNYRNIEKEKEIVKIACRNTFRFPLKNISTHNIKTVILPIFDIFISRLKEYHHHRVDILFNFDESILIYVLCDLSFYKDVLQYRENSEEIKKSEKCISKIHKKYFCIKNINFENNDINNIIIKNIFN